ncbi:helix-turn-helix domain-containing protein [Bacteroidia bacterium]|nr:helix-turn-helix domain-containing protein [Bacteroidia bacterium]
MNKEVLENVIESEMIKEMNIKMQHNQNMDLSLAHSSTDQSRTRYMTLKSAATYLDVSTRTIYRLIAKGWIPNSKGPLGYRIDKVEIDQWMKSYRSVLNELPEIVDF